MFPKLFDILWCILLFYSTFFDKFLFIFPIHIVFQTFLSIIKIAPLDQLLICNKTAVTVLPDNSGL